MKLHDKDSSTLALYYIYCIHESRTSDGNGYVFKAYSQNSAEQWFFYDNKDIMRSDMDYIDRWIQLREMGSVDDGEES